MFNRSHAFRLLMPDAKSRAESIIDEASSEIDSFKAALAADVQEVSDLTAKLAAALTGNPSASDELAALTAKVDVLNAKLNNPVAPLAAAAAPDAPAAPADATAAAPASPASPDAPAPVADAPAPTPGS